MRLKGRKAVITGAGSGIGRASAVIFAREGAQVLVGDIDTEKGQETVDLVRAEGGQALFVKCDVSNEADVENMMAQAVKAFGGVDIVFNVAGCPQLSKPFTQITDEEWERIMAVNVKGIFLTAKYSVDELRKAGNGVILNVGSVGGLRPRPGSVAYSASKGAVQAITTALAIELASDNIRVNCINPGPVETPMLAKFIPGFKPETLEIIKQGTALKKMVAPEDIAYAAVFLASDEASKITGVALNVDAGLWIYRGAT